MEAPEIDVPAALAAQLTTLATAVGDPIPTLTSDADPATLRAWLAGVTARATRDLAACAEMDEEAHALLRTILEARDLTLLCTQFGAAQRVARERAVTQALHELRTVGTAADLLDQACDVLVARCGFERAMLSRTDGDRWLPWKACFANDGDFEQRFVAELQQERIALQDAPLERGVVERRRPAIVLDAVADGRTHKPIVELGLTQSYVVAPIIPGGRVVGFFHGDHAPFDRQVDEEDLNALWTFAEGFGRLYERAVLVERLADQRRHIEQAFDAARETIQTLDVLDVRLVDADGTPLAEPVPLPVPAFNETVRALMTDREREVLDLLVTGMGNREIADQLVVQVGTVKTHVKAILRKVGATNRAEVIARYVRGAP